MSKSREARPGKALTPNPHDIHDVVESIWVMSQSFLSFGNAHHLWPLKYWGYDSMCDGQFSVRSCLLQNELLQLTQISFKVWQPVLVISRLKLIASEVPMQLSSLFSYRPYSEYSCFWRSFTYIYIYCVYIYIFVNIDSLRSSWKGFNALNEMWHHGATWSSESVEKSPASNVSHSLAPPLLTSEGQVWMRMRRQAD